ncbi:MAG: hypothetical protein WDO24_22260 [Pseudomonadota bacterium]
MAADRSAHRAAGAAELERCIAASPGFISICVSAAGMGYPASDPIYEPFYRVCLAARRPVLCAGRLHGGRRGLPGGEASSSSCASALCRQARNPLSRAEDHRRPSGLAVGRTR